jgi:hypothetical protein
MNFPLRPCVHCGATNFYLLPNIQVEYGTATTVLGMAAHRHAAGRYWWISAIVCTQCTRTDTYTTNLAELVQVVPNAQVVTATSG